MKLTPRTLLPLLGFALATLTASAQHEQYITQADVTIEILFGTHIIKPVDSQGYITTTPILSRLGNKQILEQLVKDETITSVTGWKLVAVKAAPADLVYIDGGFSLYLIKENSADPSLTERKPFPAGKFLMAGTFYSVENFVERHQGVNVINSSGTVTNYTGMDFTPTFTSSEVVSPPVTSGGFRVSTKTYSDYVLDALHTDGHASIRYQTKVSEPVFYCAISSMTYTALGDFSGTDTTYVATTTTSVTPGSTPSTPPPEKIVDSPNIPNGGLVSVRITLGGAKLVRQSEYPEVPYF